MTVLRPFVLLVLAVAPPASVRAEPPAGDAPTANAPKPAEPAKAPAQKGPAAGTPTKAAPSGAEPGASGTATSTEATARAPELPKGEPPQVGPLDLPQGAPKPDADLLKTEQEEYEQQELGLGWQLLRTVFVLVAVIALAYLTLNVGLRKLLGIRAVPGRQHLVTVLERVPLDQKRALFVVKAANEVLLIGGSENSLELIARLDSAEVEKVRAAAGSPSALQLSPFLQKLLGRKDAPPPPAPP